MKVLPEVDFRRKSRRQQLVKGSKSDAKINPEELTAVTARDCHMTCSIINMASKGGALNMGSLNGPLNDAAARQTHKLAVSRDYISQPRTSMHSMFTWIFVMLFI